VEKLWMNGEFPVDVRTFKSFFGERLSETSGIEIVEAASLFASLDAGVAARRISFFPNERLLSFSQTVPPSVHRFEELIGGRSYLIEARPVDPDRWRAYIVRIPGVPTALMPFYGRTPAEAAKHLSDWLTRAHDRMSKAAGSV
jgi:hypothetical protein